MFTSVSPRASGCRDGSKYLPAMDYRSATGFEDEVATTHRSSPLYLLNDAALYYERNVVVRRGTVRDRVYLAGKFKRRRTVTHHELLFCS